MFYIAHKYGFVADVWIINGQKKVRFNQDIREAKPFETVEDANEALSNATYGRHFCILSTQIAYTTAKEEDKVGHPGPLNPVLTPQVAAELKENDLDAQIKALMPLAIAAAC